MNMNRRGLLKGLALGSVAGLALSSPTGLMAGIAEGTQASVSLPPTLVLLNEQVMASGFLQGAMAVEGLPLQVQRVGRSLECMLGLEQQLRDSSPLHVIGLLDDASATLLVDLARSAGARVQWLGQHAVDSEVTRHHLLGASFAPEYLQEPVDPSRSWATRIGHLLASRGAHPPPSALPALAIARPLVGHFVSFSIEA